MISIFVQFAVCNLLGNGVVAIFGPLSLSPSSTHTQSICDTLEIPHVETRWDFQLQRDDLSINLYPKTAVLAKAYVDLVKAWNWKVFAIAYEDNEGNPSLNWLHAIYTVCSYDASYTMFSMHPYL